MEDNSSLFAFPVWVFPLAVVQRKGAQIVSHLLGTADGDVADGIAFVVVPYAIAVAEVFDHIDLRVGDEGVGYHFEALGPVQGKALYVLLMLASLFVGEDIPAALVGLQ